MSGGQQISVGQGTLTYASRGQFITVSQGTLTASGNAVTVNISGVETTAEHGIVGIGGTLIGGTTITSSAGSVLLNHSIPLTGISMTASIGTMVPGIEANDTYIASGTGSTAASFNIALSGIESAMGQGTFVFSQGLIVGSASNVDQGSFQALVFGRAITGQSATVGIGTLKQVGGSPPVEMTGSGGSNGKKSSATRRIRYSDYPSRLEYMEALQKAIYVEPEYKEPAAIPISRIDMHGKVMANAETTEDDEIIKAILLMRLG